MNFKEYLSQWDLGIIGKIDYDHYVINRTNNPNLVICLGDSWTYGDSLDGSLRETQIYGQLIANDLNADLINVGCPGFSNSWILKVGQELLKYLQENKNFYQKIYVIITLTENARDIKTYYSFPFNYIQHYQNHGASSEFYQTLLDNIEDHWVKQITELVELGDTRFTYFVGQNFVWHSMYRRLPANIITTDRNWIEVLADYQGLPWPVRTNLVTGWVFDLFDESNNISGIKDRRFFKEFVLPYIERANLVNQWLDSSKLNGKVSSKHPNALGHKLWADHILERLKNIS